MRRVALGSAGSRSRPTSRPSPDRGDGVVERGRVERRRDLAVRPQPLAHAEAAARAAPAAPAAASAGRSGSGFRPSRISRTSRWPAVVSRPTGRPCAPAARWSRPWCRARCRSVARQQSARGEPEPAREFVEARDHADRLVGRRRLAALAKTVRAVVVDARRVGEGAADVDADRQPVRRRSGLPPRHEALPRSRARACADRLSGGPQPPPPAERTSKQSPGTNVDADLLGAQHARARAVRMVQPIVGAAGHPRRRACRTGRAARRRRRCWPSAGFSVSIADRARRRGRRGTGRRRRSRGGIHGAEEAGESAPRRSRRCRTSARRRNAIPRPRTSRRRRRRRRRRAGHGTCARRSCGPVRGSSPWIAIRKRRPQPAMARSGQECRSALMMASTISFEQWLVHSVTGRAGIGPDDGALLAR